MMQSGGDSRKVEANDVLPADWDPMKAAYNDPKFNSYNFGPGRDLPPSKQVPAMGDGHRQSQEGVQLYVSGIPNELHEEGVKKLFSQAGKVLRVKKLTSRQPDKDYTIGFVTMSNVREAEQAIQKCHNFDIKNGQYRLLVKMALTSEEQSARKQKQQEEEEFVKNLPSSRAEAGEDIRNVEIARPAYSPKPGLGRLNIVNEAMNVTPGRAPLVNGRQTPDSQLGSTGTSPGGSVIDMKITKTSSGIREVSARLCTLCSNPAAQKCTRCKIPYCSRICQEKHWPEHKLCCGKPPSKSDPLAVDNDFMSRFDITVGDEMASVIANELTNDKLVAAKLAKDIAEPTASSTQAQDATPGVEGQTSNPYRLKFADAQKVELSGKVQVLVTSFQSPNDFWISPVSQAENLNLLRQKMNQHYAATSNSGKAAYCPEKGQICAALFPLDKEWYRARVDRVLLDGKAVVTYIDYGNSDEISVSLTRRLDPPFTELPLQGVRCSISQVEPLGAEWTMPALVCCNQLLDQTKPHHVDTQGSDGNKTLVQFITHDALDVGSILVSENHAKLKKKSQNTTPTKPPAAVPQSTPSPKQTKSSCPGVPDLSIPPMRPAATPPTVPLCVSKPGRRGIPPPPIPTAAKYIPCGKILPIEVLELTSPSEFWVHIVDSAKSMELSQLKTAMNIHYNKLPPKTGFTPLAKLLYACKFSADNEWYRAQVLDFDTQSAQVIYLDHGNQEKVEFSNLHSLESDHCSLPFQALRCSLHGVVGTEPDGSWSPAAMKFFAMQVANQQCEAKLAEKDDVFSDLVLQLPDGSILNDKMVEVGYATKPGSGAETPRYMAASLPKLPPIKTEVQVSVVVASKLLDIVVQIIYPDEYSKPLLSLLTAMASFEPAPLDHTPEVGELVVAQFDEDKASYRAVIKEIASPDQFIVEFIDYGNIESVSHAVISAVTADLAACPILGVHCRLASILENPDVKWEAKHLLENQSFRMVVVGEGIEKQEVELYNRETGHSIGDQLIEMGYAVRKPSQSPLCTVVSLKDLKKKKVPTATLR